MGMILEKVEGKKNPNIVSENKNRNSRRWEELDWMIYPYAIVRKKEIIERKQEGVKVW